MSVRTQVLLWTAQRVSAAVLALCVVAHLVTMIYAVRHGLSAHEILTRTQGNYAWFAFYVTFVAAVAVHAPIGLRTIIGETLGWRGIGVDLTVLAVGAGLAAWGWRAAFAVFA
ncbi:MAG TPA: succinate dehydrogenase [Burkholderiales bacterium]|nr:succinate dehydrogenase [Burkholderiales bacterium]